MSAVTSKRDVLRLYRRILTLHKKKLAPHMRVLGDQYVRCVGSRRAVRVPALR